MAKCNQFTPLNFRGLRQYKVQHSARVWSTSNYSLSVSDSNEQAYNISLAM